MIGSEGAITRIEMGVLAETWNSARHPVRGPVHHAREWHTRRAEQPYRLGRVDQPCIWRLRARQDGRLAQALAELLRQPADAGLRSTHVERTRRHGAMIERAEHELVGVALPDDIDV